jgi:hypothetical protein
VGVNTSASTTVAVKTTVKTAITTAGMSVINTMEAASWAPHITREVNAFVEEYISTKKDEYGFAGYHIQLLYYQGKETITQRVHHLKDRSHEHITMP